jgi:DNA polymerase III subunit gamma/tau
VTLIASSRPRHWNAIAGQTKPVRILQAALASRFMPRGFIFTGVYGVGKTTTAYIHARALMCHEDPLGCGKCASCLCIDNHGIDTHPDFREVDAASNSGVDKARLLIEDSESLAVLGRRRVIMIDEAHRLSRESWDTFLKVLERGDTNGVFIFVTNEGDRIPGTIRSRCGMVKFNKVDTDTIVGVLTNVSNNNQLSFDLDALRIIAKYAKGHVRTAVETLSTVAALGKINRDNVEVVLDLALQTQCVQVLALVAKSKGAPATIESNLAEASRICDEACLANPPQRLIETLFAEYGRIVFAAETKTEAQIANVLTNIPDITTVLLKWSGAVTIPVDAVPLLVHELIATQDLTRAPVHRGGGNSPGYQSNPVPNDILPLKKLVSIIGDITKDPDY